MLIQTKEFRLDKQRYFQIVMKKHLRKRIWFVLLIWGFAIALAFIKMNFITILLIIYALLYPSLVLFFLKRRFNANTNPAIYRKKYLTLDDNDLITYFEDGTESTVKLDTISRIYKNRKFTKAYISQNEFVYIPRNAFDSKKNYDSFILKLVK